MHDLISRNAIFQSVQNMVDGDKMIPFTSIPRITIHILVGRDFGEVHVPQGQGVEQGDLPACKKCSSIHLGKTKLWNARGIEPTGAAGLSAAARMHNPQAVVR